MKKKIFVLLLVLCTINWMYLSPVREKWQEIADKFPSVKYKVNPNLLGFNSTDAPTFIDNVRTAAEIWSFQNSESRFGFAYNGTTTEQALGYESIKCDFDSKELLKQKEGIVFATNEDSDCTGQACSYIWTCKDSPEILHFDIEINGRDYEWDLGTNHKKSFNLITILAKEFGHIAGLGHCSSGLSEADCQTQAVAQGTTNPDENSLMNRFVNAEVIKTNLGADDKAGLDAIYGQATPEEIAMRAEMFLFHEKANAYCTAPCVTPDKETNPKYKYSADDLMGIQLYWEELSEEGKNNPAWLLSKYRWIQNDYYTSFNYNKNSAEQYLTEVIENFDLYQSGAIPDYYKLERILISIQISTKQKLLEDSKLELAPQFYKFTESELKILIALRRKYIDLL